jgi:hypothetical protein
MAREDTQQDCTELKPIDAERVIRILEHDIHPAQERDASARGDLAAAWKAIEDECACNKGAAKLYFKLSGWSDEKRDDFLRSLWALMKAGNMGISSDLVDKMEAADGAAPTMPIVAPTGPTVADLATTTQH